MKVMFIGVAEKSGGAVVEQAVAAGHDVTVFVHETEGYLPDSNVRVIEGDARDRPAMDSTMLGQDAVIDTIGGKLSFKTTTLEAGAAATITALVGDLPLVLAAKGSAKHAFGIHVIPRALAAVLIVIGFAVT